MSNLSDYSDFVSDETNHCREGMSYYEPNSINYNTTMNTTFDDEVVSELHKKSYVEKFLRAHSRCA